MTDVLLFIAGVVGLTVAITYLGKYFDKAVFTMMGKAINILSR